MSNQLNDREPPSSSLEEYDLVIRGGRLMDPRNGIDQIMDIAVKDGVIASLFPHFTGVSRQTINADGLLVTPGIIDIHAHAFWGTTPNAYIANSYTSLPPDGFTFRSGVTTLVDAGSSGWRDFQTFKEQTIDRAKTRVLAFINIVGSGMRGGAYEQNLEDMNPEQTARKAEQNSSDIVGIKLAHFRSPQWTPTEKALLAGRLASLPVMIDFGGSKPELSLESLLLHHLRPGDIFTHCYAHSKGRTPVVDENGAVRKCVIEAQRNGVILDVGHGGGSFRFDQAIPAIQQGLKPNSISTDLHAGSMNGSMKDISNIMSKLWCAGLTLNEVIEASTWKPAQIIRRTDLGHLSPGAVADVAIFNLQKGNFGFTDVVGKKLQGQTKFVCELTLRNGKIVWDLNGLGCQT